MSPEFVSFDINHFMNSAVPKSRVDNSELFSDALDLPDKSSFIFPFQYSVGAKKVLRISIFCLS
ncbi:hypothetical protein [Candidatus Nitrosocosmicus sp. FF01]|uniref:hypothetical protein n=1 Tax=Candidatus Nitrosocosmicus sp. FF01 TaxID=3397670 RepID=UPI0039EBC2FD